MAEAVAPSAPARPFHRLAIIAVAVLAFGSASVGTWASFTASTTNSATFATGSLLLSNQVNAATTCLSSGPGNVTDDNDYTCDQFFAATVQRPGDSASADVTLGNDGNLDGDFSAFLAECTDSDASETFHGTGDVCGALQITIQEFASEAARTGDDVTGGNCRYGATTGAGVDCAFGPTVDDLVAAHGDFGTAIDLGPLAPGEQRWFEVGVLLPTSAGNPLQGRQATFGITWRLQQQ